MERRHPAAIAVACRSAERPECGCGIVRAMGGAGGRLYVGQGAAPVELGG